MTDSKLHIAERQVDDVTILTLTGEVMQDDGDLAIRQTIHDLIGRGRVKIVVDLGGVTHIDSSGIGMLAAKLKTVRESGGDLRLLNLTRRSQRILGMMKLTTTFEMFEEEAAAVQSFSSGPRG